MAPARLAVSLSLASFVLGGVSLAGRWADSVVAESGASLPSGVLPEVVARIKEKERASDALLAGGLTLEEATARFRRLNAGIVEPSIDTWNGITGDSVEERTARQVIFWAAGRVRERGAGGAEVLALRARLEGQLGDALAGGPAR